jgi:hypothetical protein
MEMIGHCDDDGQTLIGENELVKGGCGPRRHFTTGGNVRQLSEENFGKFSLLCCSAEIFVAIIIQGEESSFV